MVLEGWLTLDLRDFLDLLKQGIAGPSTPLLQMWVEGKVHLAGALTFKELGKMFKQLRMNALLREFHVA